MNKKYDLVLHLSDIDFDGFCAQYFTSLTDETIIYFNAKIHDLNEKINQVFEVILENKDKKILFLITDLSLESHMIKKFNNFKRGNKNIDIDYQLLDHHKSNADGASEEWYYFDNNRCAAKITADWIIENYSFTQEEQENILYIAEMVDAHDRWQEDSPFHNKGNFISDKVYNTKFIDGMEDEKRKYLFYIIETYSTLLKTKSIFEVESLIPKIDLEFLDNKIDQNLYNNMDQSVKIKFFNYFAEFFIKQDNIKLLKFKELSVLVFFNLDGTIYQYMSKDILHARKDIDFIVNIKGSGSMSFRSQKEVDVSEIAKHDFGGGGHKNAAGAKITLQNVHSKEELYKVISNYGFKERD